MIRNLYMENWCFTISIHWLVVEPTHLKNMSQIGNLPQVGVKIKNIWNHHLVHKKDVEVGSWEQRLDQSGLYGCNPNISHF